MKVLFVCTGNTCRSPMSEGIASKLFSNIDFKSAGLFVNSFEKVSTNAVEAVKRLGIDISNHSPTQITFEIAKNADLIIPMTLSHKIKLTELGVSSKKIKMFNQEICDPYGSSLDVYYDCAEQLKKNIINLFGELNGN